MNEAVADADIFVTTTGNKDVITLDHMKAMKHNAIVGNIGHFDNEIQMSDLEAHPGVEKIEIKPQVHEFKLPEGHSIIVLAEGRLLNLGCATGHPSFVMSASFTNQVLAQMELHDNADRYSKDTVHVLPKHLDEMVARLHLEKLGIKLTEMTTDQASISGSPRKGRSSLTTTGIDPSRGCPNRIAPKLLHDWPRLFGVSLVLPPTMQKLPGALQSQTKKIDRPQKSSV